MWLSKTILNQKNFTNSTYWRVVEYTHLIDQDQINLVVKWYASKEVRDEHGVDANNDVKVYYIDTKKKFVKEEIMEDKIIPAVESQEAIEATYDEEWIVLTPFVPAIPEQPERIEKVGTGQFKDVWINEDKYIDVSQLVDVILPFIYDNLVARGDFIWSELA